MVTDKQHTRKVRAEKNKASSASGKVRLEQLRHVHSHVRKVHNEPVSSYLVRLRPSYFYI